MPSAAEAVPQEHDDGAAPLHTEQPAATAAAPECPDAKAESAQREGGKPDKPQAAETLHNKENVSQNPSQQDPSQDAAPHTAENQPAGEAPPATPKGAAIKPHSKSAADVAGSAKERAGGAPGAGAAKDASEGGATAGAAGGSPLPSSASPVTPSPRAASSGPAAQRAKTGASTASSERTRAADSADAAAAGKGAVAAAGAAGAADAKAEGGKGAGRGPQQEADVTLEAGAAAAAAAAAAAGVGGSGELVITRSGRRAHITPIPLAPLDPQVTHRHVQNRRWNSKNDENNCEHCSERKVPGAGHYCATRCIRLSPDDHCFPVATVQPTVEVPMRKTVDRATPKTPTAASLTLCQSGRATRSQVSPPARGRGAAEWEAEDKISGDKAAADKHGRSSQNGGAWRSAQRQSAAKRSLSSRGAKMVRPSLLLSDHWHCCTWQCACTSFCGTSSNSSAAAEGIAAGQQGFHYWRKYGCSFCY